MKLLIDANVILDLFDGERPGVKESLQILDFCQLKMLEGYFAVFSVPTILYILRDDYPNVEDQQRVVEAISHTVKPVEMKAEDLEFPFRHGFKDYEDGLQAAAAERVGADYIITHNLKDFKSSAVMPITPEDFMGSVVEGYK